MRLRRPRRPGTDPGPRTTAALLGLLGVAVLSTGACQRQASLPVLGAVPAFALTERSGATVRAEDLVGSVWVAGFIFTRCPGICPALTARMATLQRLETPADDPIRLVSFTVDPAYDTPLVLARYAARAGAGDDWLFLTGPRDEIALLLHDGFHLAFADDGPENDPITHSDRLVLVDRARQIRGYYHGTDPEAVARLAADALALHARGG